MGYRSQVILAVSKEVMPQFMSTMAKSPEARTLCFSEADRTVKDYEDPGGMLFCWGHIKWYDSYEEIQALQDFIEWCQSEQIEVDGKEVSADEYYRFVRIGEETDDNEVTGWGFDIHIERTATY